MWLPPDIWKDGLILAAHIVFTSSQRIFRMFALRQIDREPVVRRLQMKTVLKLGRGDPLPFSCLSTPLLYLDPLFCPFPFPLLSFLQARLGAGWLSQPTHLLTPFSWLTRDCPASPFSRLGRVGEQHLVPATILPTPPAPLAFKSEEAHSLGSLGPALKTKTIHWGSGEGWGGMDQQNSPLHSSKSKVTWRKHARGWGAHIQETLGLGAFFTATVVG